MRALSLPLAASVLLGCASSTPKPTEPTPEVAATETAPASPLEKLRRDYVPLVDKAPSWLTQSAPRALAKNVEELAMVMDMLEDESSPTARHVSMLAQMVFLLTDFERGLGDKRCDLDCLTVQASALRLLATWSEVFEMEFFKDLFTPAVAMMGMASQEQELRAFLQHVLAHAQDNWKHVMLLRYEHPDIDDAAAAETLIEMADEVSSDGEHALAADLYALALERHPASMGPTLALSMASNCYRALDTACGDEKLERAGTVSDELLEKAELVAKEGSDAKLVVSSPTAPSLAESIAVGRALMRLDRLDEARTRFETLQKEAPRDARVVAGLAELHIEETMSFGKARKLLQEARDFENKDADYYELLIGSWMEEFKSMLLGGQADGDQVLDRLEAEMVELETHLEAYTRFNADKGQTLLFAIRAGRVLLRRQNGKASGAELRQVLESLIPAVNAAVAQQKGPYLRRLQLVLSRFDTDSARGLQVVGAAESLEGVAELHRNIKTSLLLAAGSELEAAAAALEKQTDVASMDQRAALLAALASQSGKAEQWRAVGDIYMDLANRAPDAESRSRFVNNLAVAAFHLGQKKEARALLTQAEGETPTIATLNKEVTSESPDLVRLQAVASPDSDLPAMAKVQAHMWLQRFEKKRLLRDKEKNGLMQEHGGPIIGPRVTGERGVILENSFSMGFGFSPAERLTIELGLEVLPWLIVPATQPL